MDVELITNLLLIAGVVSVITCMFIQQTKAKVKKKFLTFYTFVVNMALGIFFSLTLANLPIVESVWVGIFSFIGADKLYLALEGKLKSYSDLVPNDKVIEIPRENIIEIEEE